MMNIFDWDKVRPALVAPSPSRKMVIRAAFQQWIEGNSWYYGDMDDTELDIAFEAFQAAWVICEETMKDV